MDDTTMVTAMVERHVSALSGFSVELMAEDLQIWTKAYKEDKSHMATYTKLCQGQKYQDLYLAPSGPMARMVGGQQKIIVPRSLRQQILKECHNVPFTGHVGMHKTLELVDRQFHWRGLRGDTIQYMKTCPTCQIMISDSRATAGLLKPFEIPSRKWAHVTTDLVTDLPESNGFMAIVVFIDKLTKTVHLAGCKKEVTAMEYAQIFVDNFFELHGLP